MNNLISDRWTRWMNEWLEKLIDGSINDYPWMDRWMDRQIINGLMDRSTTLHCICTSPSNKH